MENSNLSEGSNIEKNYANIQIVLFIFVIFKILFYQSISSAHSIKYMILVLSVFLATFSSDMFFDFITKRNDIQCNNKAANNSYPIVTSLIISSFLNFGYHIALVFICAFLSVFFIKNLFGNFGNNLFNAPASFMILLNSFNSYMVTMSSMNSNSDRFFLSLFNAKNSTHISEIVNLKDAIFSEQLPYVKSTTMLFLLLIIIYFLLCSIFVNNNTSMALIILLFLFILCFSFVGFLNGTAHLQFNILQLNGFLKYIIASDGPLGHTFKTILLLIYMIIGPTILGILLCTSCDITMPQTGLGKYCVGFFLAFCILYTKIFTNNPIGIFYGIIIANSCTPMLNKIIKHSNKNTQITIISLTLMSLIIGFIAFVFAMKGV